MHKETVWSFKTARFSVALEITYEPNYQYDGDDEDGSIQDAIYRGDYVAFDSAVVVRLDGLTGTFSPTLEAAFAPHRPAGAAARAGAAGRRSPTSSASDRAIACAILRTLAVRSALLLGSLLVACRSQPPDPAQGTQKPTTTPPPPRPSKTPCSPHWPNWARSRPRNCWNSATRNSAPWASSPKADQSLVRIRESCFTAWPCLSKPPCRMVKK